ncbi:hypothetical protein MLD38_033409 [Melastoma candidum]|uniref:Uncharacterized protein n=1 Tax=Melastoma candidum TaxID=119954 RepID=A0ACB9M6C9_9MYRT|nr:hypothetical protein MLD38_033409 [Melastoma candidum]
MENLLRFTTVLAPFQVFLARIMSKLEILSSRKRSLPENRVSHSWPPSFMGNYSDFNRFMSAMLFLSGRIWSIKIVKNWTKEQILDYVNQLCEKIPSPMDESTVNCESLSSMPRDSSSIGGRVFDLVPGQYILKVWRRMC